MQLENIDNEDGGTCNVNGPNGSSNGSAFIEAILFDFFISVNSSKIINPSNTSPNFFRIFPTIVGLPAFIRPPLDDG